MDISSTSLLVLSQAVKQVDDAAEGIRRAVAIDVENPALADQADISTEAINLLAGRTAFRAGVELVKAADEMALQTIDLLA
jgi:hypothetical protein